MTREKTSTNDAARAGDPGTELGGDQGRVARAERENPSRHVPLRQGPPDDRYEAGAIPSKEGMRSPVPRNADRTPGSGRTLTGDVEVTGARKVYVLVRKAD